MPTIFGRRRCVRTTGAVTALSAVMWRGRRTRIDRIAMITTDR
jgi:hypothetical protein